MSGTHSQGYTCEHNRDYYFFISHSRSDNVYHVLLYFEKAMAKSRRGKAGHPPTRVNLSQPLYDKNVDSFVRIKMIWLGGSY